MRLDFTLPRITYVFSDSIRDFHVTGILKKFFLIFQHFFGAKFQNGLPEIIAPSVIIKPLNKIHQSKCTKKAPECANFKNGGNDEARTRDLMRDRHAL